LSARPRTALGKSTAEQRLTALETNLALCVPFCFVRPWAEQRLAAFETNLPTASRRIVSTRAHGTLSADFAPIDICSQAPHRSHTRQPNHQMVANGQGPQRVL
jgi:hypothetical protein